MTHFHNWWLEFDNKCSVIPRKYLWWLVPFQQLTNFYQSLNI